MVIRTLDTPLYGIDVSKWNGTINWDKVNTDFVICKITQKNNSVEPSFEKNYAGATAKGLPVGAYRYVYAQTIAEAKAEANAVVKILNGRKLAGWFWIDMEDSSIKRLGKQKLTAIIDAEAEILEAAGYKVGIYCNREWYNKVLDSAELKNRYLFWIARYPLYDNGKLKESLSPKSYAAIWQYSSKGKVDGISGNVDMNIAYVDFIVKEDVPTVEKEPEDTPIINGDPFPLKNGSRGDNVDWVQRMLAYKFGINCESVDGKFGDATEIAVKEFQLMYGLKIDGIVGNATREALDKLNKITPSDINVYKLQRVLNTNLDARLVCDGKMGPKTVEACPILKYGDRSEIVKAYQDILVCHYKMTLKSATGFFSKETVTKTMALQKLKKLTKDGCVGPNTWTSISKDM